MKVRESAPSKIGLLCIALFTVPRADDDVVVDDFGPNCICVFVYLYILMSDTWEHCF